MIAYLLAASLACDPALTALFTPLRPLIGRYEVCTTADPLERVAAPAPDGPQYGPSEALDPLEAFGAAGPYDRAALARLYAGQRVRVARGWVERDDRFESITLLSPHPDATLARLRPGTMVIKWTLQRGR
jgi:hypothetical protein